MICVERTVYIENREISLCSCIAQEDDRFMYDCWCDPEVQKGYNFAFSKTFEEFSAQPSRAYWNAIIVRKPDGERIGRVMLSSPDSAPDLAIMLAAPMRGQGFGTQAFSLALEYCFGALKLPCVYAGCYEDNVRSRKMLEKLGFEPHPEGNLREKHYLTGIEIVQYDYVKRNPGTMDSL